MLSDLEAIKAIDRLCRAAPRNLDLEALRVWIAAHCGLNPHAAGPLLCPRTKACISSSLTVTSADLRTERRQDRRSFRLYEPARNAHLPAASPIGGAKVGTEFDGARSTYLAALPPLFFGRFAVSRLASSAMSRHCWATPRYLLFKAGLVARSPSRSHWAALLW
jgi:hypothetical protein